MSDTHPSGAERKAARDAIIQAANNHKLRNRFFFMHRPTLYNQRQLQRAVFYCRQHELKVDYVKAGFRHDR